MTDGDFLQQAIALARDNVDQGGRPFGAVVVRDGAVIARAVNRMEADKDPTAHAELLALRAAGALVGSTRLDGCVVYASGQPCPMCLAAMRLAGVGRIVFAYSNDDAAPFGLSTAEISRDLSMPPDVEGLGWAAVTHIPQPDQGEPGPYRAWAARHVLRG